MATMADTNSSPTAQEATPFMAQYLSVKAEHPDALLFFRMGDFYELFFSDAVEAARILDITLTSRGEHDGKKIPMAGVPVHAADGYLARLIRAGQRVAVCEQVETPAEARKRGSKAIVRREIVRVVTPGTLTEDTLLPARQSQALAAIAFAGTGQAALAVCDVSTGAFDLAPVGPGGIGEALMAWPLSELLVAEPDAERESLKEILSYLSVPVVYRPGRVATPKSGEALLRDFFEIAALDGIGEFSRVELSAAGLLLDYLRLTQAGGPVRLRLPGRPAEDGFLLIDPATRSSLEIDRTGSGGRDATLLSCVDRTLTAPGARLLASRLARPSRCREEIIARHDGISYFLGMTDLLATLREQLRGVPDIERACMRLSLGRGGPRDLLALARAARTGVALSRLFDGPLPARLASVIQTLSLSELASVQAFSDDVSRALIDDPPVLARDGGFVTEGWDAALDELRELRDGSRRVIAGLQEKYAERSGISTLKIRFNNVLGYFVEVPAARADPMLRAPLSSEFIHRQTLAGAVRFSTHELADLAGRISRAEEEAKSLELGVFARFSEMAASLAGAFALIAAALAELDVASANAAWAGEIGAVRPEIDSRRIFEARGLRHPVVEAALRRQGLGFTANDLMLDAEGFEGARLLLVTGPNMAGKSTYLRQAALAVILAQAGLFVPASSLRLGLADRLFSRVGASDDLARGRSTFMVEMVETAAILNQAGPESFVILDEVGRGTATFDGLAIAWAAAEHLHEVNRCRAIFATHYHELTDLAARLPAGANASLKAREWKQELIFLHEVCPGPADRSYGVQVARLAGLPRSAVQRAGQILRKLEAGQSAGESLPLFAISDPEPAPAPEHAALVEALCETDPDNLSPREALELVYRLRKMIVSA